MEHKIHQGRNIKRFREMLGIKQEVLAFDLGDNWTQKKISLLEKKEVIDNSLLQEISNILAVPIEAIKNFDSKRALSIISNTHIDPPTQEYHYDTINPITAIVQLHNEKIELYERIIKEKDEMMNRLEKLIQSK
ncbi:helix-turn-helix domain-containing protein [Myroides odoratimimus]|uniref:helix-turn-helix domain-containing protein n=1 Tax=Myroides odoratimimus TaxID=76832 RepID=UPI002DBA3C32|nr:helix-turn-helix transcriptional regulator [Myroides odoratimimus]MEC4041905.1 helix-turn-helix transcriptional regulator [Myroides odoratimimus]MEC4149863.1 helix-turn-helix transcriptional regulator [Myroides odoratimimus]